MLVQNIEEITIFESPDGGKTIYSRRSGEAHRELVRETTEAKTASRWVNLRGAIELAETNETLNAILCQLEVMYELIKDRSTASVK